MEVLIKEKLKNIETKYDINILFACESGSRVWGFNNSESDYDIRFIYKKRTLNDYLTIKPQKDTINVMDGLFDFSGWDIKKALYLHYKSNPSLREWLASDIVYVKDTIDIFDNLEDFNHLNLKYHYTSMALSNWRKYRCYGVSNFNLHNAKKYSYIIRSILSWNILDIDNNPPLDIYKLIDLSNLGTNIEEDILYLLRYYKSSDTSEFNSNVLLNLNSWIFKNLEKMTSEKSKNINTKNINKYDERFYKIITN